MKLLPPYHLRIRGSCPLVSRFTFTSKEVPYCRISQPTPLNSLARRDATSRNHLMKIALAEIRKRSFLTRGCNCLGVIYTSWNDASSLAPISRAGALCFEPLCRHEFFAPSSLKFIASRFSSRPQHLRHSTSVLHTIPRPQYNCEP